jgi:sulfite reductase (ferredoxin)
MAYTIPETLDAEIDGLEREIAEFLAGRLDPAAMKAKRVPMGVYEQREAGTYMVRIRCTGGHFTPAQLGALARLAREYAEPFIHLTTRMEAQLHHVKLERVPELQRKLKAIGLSSRGGGGNTVRNIMASPEAGTTLEEAFDVGPWVDALTDKLLREPDSFNLPRKFKLAFSATDADSAHACFNDLGFFPRLRDGQPGFKVYAAGGLGSKPRVALLLHEFLPARELHLFVTAVKRFFDQNGNRKNKRQARLRFLRDKFGDQGLLDKLNEATATLRAQGFPDLAPGGRQRPDTAPAPGVPAEAPVDSGFEAWKQRYVSQGRLAGRYNVLIPILLGDLEADKAETLAKGLEPFGDNVLRAHIRQNLALAGVPGSHLASIYNLLAPLELTRLPSLLGSIVACTGADTCKLGMCLPKGATDALAQRLLKSGLDLDTLAGVRIHISGCPNTCAQHTIADLGFYGMAQRQGQHMYPAYAVLAGGVVGEGKARLAHEIARVAAKSLPGYIVDCLRAYQEGRKPGQGFGDWVEQGGEARLKELAEGRLAVAEWDEDKNPYFDWGADEPFSPAKGGAECSAGLFDLIDVDRKAIASQKEALAKGLQGAKAAEAHYQIALSASRMLLVTRGVEPKSDAGVFESFTEWFIIRGLIDDAFKPLVQACADGRGAGFAGLAKDSLALADAVEALYQGMDDSLRFPAEAAGAVPGPSPQARGGQSLEAAQSRDYRGVACPMNFVKVKLDLAKMAKGQVLKVLLDDGQPIQNVPGSVSLEGHEVAAVTRQPEGHWELTIRKR